MTGVGDAAVLTIPTSTVCAPVAPPLPVLSVLLAGTGSGSAAEAVAPLSNEPVALIVAVTLTVTFAAGASVGIVHGSAAQPPPLTFVIVRCVGVSVTWMFVAADGPAFATTSVQLID